MPLQYVLGLICLISGLVPVRSATGQSEPDPWTRGLTDSAAPFDSVYAWLQAGPRYQADVPTGELHRIRRDRAGTAFPYVVVVPDSYDPTKTWPVRVYLHGTVMRPAWRENEFFEPANGPGYWRSFSRWSGNDYISVFPAGWDAAPWWSLRQVENLHEILTGLRGEYNIDENQVHLLGFSDGGSGVWFHASRAPTLWASYNAWISHPGVVGTETTGSDGEFHPAALFGKPFYVVNAEADRLYPAEAVSVVMSFLRERGVDITFHRRPGGHGLAWLSDEFPSIRAFMERSIRDPLPNQVSWQTTFDNRYLRNHWVLITALGTVGGEARFAPSLLFRAIRPAGRIEVLRDGNTLKVRTQGVRRFRLLLSPEEIDFGHPVRIVVNGRTVLNGKLKRNADTLRRWAMIDHDRTMLFGAEVEIEVPGRR